MKKGTGQGENAKANAAYGAIFNTLTLEPSHLEALSKRGLSSQEIAVLGYKSWPRQRKAVVTSVGEALDTKTFRGVPGFFLTPSGDWDLAGAPGIAIPIRNKEGDVVGIKIRVDKPNNPQSKYILLSSNPKSQRGGADTYPEGTAATVHAHYPLEKPRGGFDTLRITEGEIKADVLTNLTDIYTVALPGVKGWRMALDVVKALKPKVVLLAFDSDKVEAKNVAYGEQEDVGDAPPEEDFIVAKALASLYMVLDKLGTCEVKIEDWPPEAGKGLDDVVLNGAQDKVTLLLGDAARAWANDVLLKEEEGGTDLNDWLYIVGVKRFYHSKSLLELDKEQFCDQFCHNSKGNPAFKALTNPAFPKYNFPIYLPNQPIVVKQGAHTCFNLWRPSGLKPKEGDASPFTDHIAYLLPEEREQEILLDWLTFNLQQPGTKVNWAMLLQGRQGTGKSLIGYVMRELLGPKNISMPTNDIIHEIYTGWQRSCSLIIVEELMARGRLELMNKLKPMITQDTTVVREMHKPPYEQPNVFNLLLFTNHEDAILIDESDRRYCVMFSPAEIKEHTYYEQLWAWTNKNLGVLLHYFQNRTISCNFQAKAPAPMTAAKGEVIRSSMNPLASWVLEKIEGEQWPFNLDVLALHHVLPTIPTEIQRRMGHISTMILGKTLTGAGARAIGQFKMSKEHGSQLVTLYSTRRHEIWAGAEEATLLAEYERWSTNGEPGSNSGVRSNPLMDGRPM